MLEKRRRRLLKKTKVELDDILIYFCPFTFQKRNIEKYTIQGKEMKSKYSRTSF